jgi:hypothetical protein
MILVIYIKSNISVVVNGLNKERVVFGKLCKFSDPCYLVTCDNGGTCTNGTCDCAPGFIGQNCEGK